MSPPTSLPRSVRRVLGPVLLLIGAILALHAPAQPAPPGATARVALVADIEGAIGPATARHVERVLALARERRASLVVLRMDTPGGLSDSMREIIKAILASPVPVATYVSPSGARAASAGTYILYASHVAAMAPGTNLGAATPVRVGGGLPLPGGGAPGGPQGLPGPPAVEPGSPQGGTAPAGGAPAADAPGGAAPAGDTPGGNTPTGDTSAGDTPTGDTSAGGAGDGHAADGGAPGVDGSAADAPRREAGPTVAPGNTMDRKAVNDAVAYIRALADLRGRNAEWAERAVREAASLPANEALARNVIDLTPPTLEALLSAVDGRTVDVLGAPVTLATAGLAVEEVEPSWQIRVLSIITNPNVAFLLMMIGIYGLIFEFSNPGSIGPGVLGAICLLLGLYALNMLPLDYAGLALLLLGLAFMVAEAVTPSFGVLGVGGLVAFVFGASILLDSDSPYFQLSWEIIAVTALASAALLALILGFALRAQRRPVTTGNSELTGAPATVLEWQGGRGFVRARGERWQARGGESFEHGARVRVTGVDGLTLRIADPDADSNGEQS